MTIASQTCTFEVGPLSLDSGTKPAGFQREGTAAVVSTGKDRQEQALTLVLRLLLLVSDEQEDGVPAASDTADPTPLSRNKP